VGSVRVPALVLVLVLVLVLALVLVLVLGLASAVAVAGLQMNPVAALRWARRCRGCRRRP
jgi:uncharacterized BrkB/YihY/UPF0761 family membrane protein